MDLPPNLSNPLSKAPSPDTITILSGKEFHRIRIQWVKYTVLLLRIHIFLLWYCCTLFFNLLQLLSRILDVPLDSTLCLFLIPSVSSRKPLTYPSWMGQVGLLGLKSPPPFSILLTCFGLYRRTLGSIPPPLHSLLCMSRCRSLGSLTS